MILLLYKLLEVVGIDIMAAWAMDQNGGTAKDQNLRFIVENLMDWLVT